MEFKHIPVLFNETIDSLNIKPDGIYADCTAGGGGHSGAILERLSEKGRLVMIDQDPEAIANLRKKFADNNNVLIINRNFKDIDEIARENAIDGFDGILADLGVSSHQLDTPERGFSFHSDAPLDMRMSKQGISAADIVNTYDEKELARILLCYGEEKFAKSIARLIVARRKEQPFETTFQLVEVIKDAIPARARREGGHPARRSFQALRISVNQEISILPSSIEKMFNLLNPEGVLSIITFHSLEDRIVKQTFAELSSGCTCPPSFPVCVCGNKPKIKFIGKKPILPSEDELSKNSRSHSAKLRVCEKI